MQMDTKLEDRSPLNKQQDAPYNSPILILRRAALFSPGHQGSHFAAKSGGKVIATGQVHQFRWSQLDLSACPAVLLLLRRRCAFVPSIVKYHWHPAIPTSFLAQATQGRKWHMWTRDQNILSREFRQQLIPRRRSRSLVDVEDRGDLGMLQLDALCMDDVAPKQDFLSL